MAPRAIITGAAGLIGQYLVKTAARWAHDWEVRGLTRADLDLTDHASIDRTWQSIKPDA
jgi:dTDP-4-dehydrorhamnose reductase